MPRISLLAAFVVPAVPALAVACSSDPPPATPIAPPQAATGAPVGPAGASASPSGYQQPGYTPTPSGSVTPGQMSTPGPTALACQSDGQCMFHHCNMQFKKCTFPCQSDADCLPGATCFVAGGPAAICMPKQ